MTRREKMILNAIAEYNDNYKPYRDTSQEELSYWHDRIVNDPNNIFYHLYEYYKYAFTRGERSARAKMKRDKKKSA